MKCESKLADTPWVKHEDEMAKKTAIRALAKYLPLSVEFMEAMDVDEARADFRAFAMDPTQGVLPDADDGDTIDGEVGEPDPKPETEKPKADPKPKAEPEKKAATPEKKPEPTKTQDAAQADAEVKADQAVTDLFNGDDEKKAAAETAGDVDLLKTPFALEVLRDAGDFGETAARATHAAQLDYFATNDKPLFEAIDAELKSIGG